MSPGGIFEGLTAREREVLARIAEGKTNAEIAHELGISFATAKTHVSAILAKLGVEDRQQAARWWREGGEVRGRPRRSWSWRSMPVAPIAAGLGFFGLVTIIAVAVALFAGAGDEPDAFAGTWPPPGEIAYVGVEAGGQTALSLATGSGAGHIYAVSPSGTMPERLTQDGSETRFWPIWSPDGQWIAFFQRDMENGEGIRDDTASLRAIGRASGNEVTLANRFPLIPDFTINDGEAPSVPFPLVPRPSWYRDSRTVAFVNQGFITATASIDEGFTGDQYLGALYPSWSKGGDRGVWASGTGDDIAFGGPITHEFRGTGEREYMTDVVRVANGGGGSFDELGEIEIYPAFSPDGRWIAWWGFQPGECCAEVYLLDTEQPVTPVPPPTYVEYGYSIAPEVREVGEGMFPRWSADSARIAFMRETGGGCTQIVVYDVAEGSPQAITGEDECAHSPAWSSADDWLAFVSDRDDEHGEIYIVRPDGSEAQRITFNDISETMLDWGKGSE